MRMLFFFSVFLLINLYNCNAKISEGRVSEKNYLTDLRQGHPVKKKEVDNELEPICGTEYPAHPQPFFRAIAGNHVLWGTAGDRLVPYKFLYSTLKQTDIPVFKEAMEYIESVSCVRFEERSGQETYMEISRVSKAVLGFSGSQVDSTAGSGFGRAVRLRTSTTLRKGNYRDIGHITHELLHVLGTHHTQKRNDRDEYITVDMSKNDNNYQYSKCYFCDNKSIPYDCMSIMHYRDWAFRTSEDPTMVAKDPETCDLKRTNRWLRWADIDLLNTNYQCQEPIPLAQEEGVLTSHESYPEGEYPDQKAWIKYLVVPQGNTIEFTFVDEFDIEADGTSKCDYDSVEIVDGNGMDLLPRACGTDRPASVVSNTNRAYVAFVADGTNTRKGFKLQWRQIGDVTTTTNPVAPLTGTLTSPNYPENYEDDFDKTYPIIVEEGKVVEIEFTDFEVENEPSCGYDWLMITENNEDILMNKSCGSGNPSVDLVSKTNSVNVRFFTDGSQTMRGWSLTWRSVPAPATQLKYITSPNYPENYDNHLKNKIYSIETPGKEGKLELNFTDFEIENGDSCKYDSVEIIDGDGTTLMGKTCGDENPDKIISHTHKVNVILNTDETVQKRGFKLEWKVVQT